jgi:hypothetical protein
MKNVIGLVIASLPEHAPCLHRFISIATLNPDSSLQLFGNTLLR